ncbi:hypothetical protein J4573_10530 [Actinomadura barringtoniae]|uniref:Uncharacterized protein n=1 Tax=Actinomadura barringtoniae TaxID=1427535 RepID=A0A939PD79_9ACTN|nr:hypothetical protein [Actinomadura barringtoniae]MBO2447524.1 hypothetical protein [Actinomadura barringtoniae]
MNDIDTLVGRIAPVTDARAAELLSDEAAAELADRIVSSSAETPEEVSSPGRPRRRLTIGLPLLATGLAGATAVTALVFSSGGGSPAPGPSTTSTSHAPKVQLAAALTFTRKGGHIDVRIRDPYADPKRYKEEFAKRGLDVDLTLIPSSPSIVGSVVMIEGDITPINEKGACAVASGGDDCPVGVRIPAGYKGHAAVAFARAARPGEQYNSTANADAPGEVMHGMVYRKRRVSEVLAALAKRHVTVPEYRYEHGNESKAAYPGQIPGDWYVHDASPWAAGQVMLFVGPHPTERPGDAAPPNVDPNAPDTPPPGATPAATPSATPTS